MGAGQIIIDPRDTDEKRQSDYSKKPKFILEIFYNANGTEKRRRFIDRF